MPMQGTGSSWGPLQCFADVHGVSARLFPVQVGTLALFTAEVYAWFVVGEIIGAAYSSAAFPAPCTRLGVASPLGPCFPAWGRLSRKAILPGPSTSPVAGKARWKDCNCRRRGAPAVHRK